MRRCYSLAAALHSAFTAESLPIFDVGLTFKWRQLVCLLKCLAICHWTRENAWSACSLQRLIYSLWCLQTSVTISSVCLDDTLLTCTIAGVFAILVTKANITWTWWGKQVTSIYTEDIGHFTVYITSHLFCTITYEEKKEKHKCTWKKVVSWKHYWV